MNTSHYLGVAQRASFLSCFITKVAACFSWCNNWVMMAFDVGGNSDGWQVFDLGIVSSKNRCSQLASRKKSTIQRFYYLFYSLDLYDSISIFGQDLRNMSRFQSFFCRFTLLFTPL